MPVSPPPPSSPLCLSCLPGPACSPAALTLCLHSSSPGTHIRWTVFTHSVSRRKKEHFIQHEQLGSSKSTSLWRQTVLLLCCCPLKSVYSTQPTLHHTSNCSPLQPPSILSLRWRRWSELRHTWPGPRQPFCNTAQWCCETCKWNKK